MDRALRAASVLVVIALGVPPGLEIASIDQTNQRVLAATLFVLAVVAGVYASVRRRPLGLRVTTAAYGVFGIGFGLFVSNRPVPFLLAYVVGLLGMNVLAYHAQAFGPVLAAFREEDDASRRARAVALRSLAISGGGLAFTFGASLALMPVFAIGVGSTDPLSALGTALALLAILLFLSLLPEAPVSILRRGKV